MRLNSHSSQWRGPVAGALLVLGLLTAPCPAAVPSPARFSGTIVGLVTDVAGVPLMGATVLLYDRQDRLRDRLFTDEKGSFNFDRLASGVYSLRVTLPAFMPVFRSNILVTPGARSVLNVSLAGLFSTITLVYPGAEQRSLMSDDWKWVLRTSSATRPVTRLLPSLDPTGGLGTRSSSSAVFTDTRALVTVSAGEGGRPSSFGNESDLGTAFALATSIFGANQLQVSGNFGYAAASGLPSAGFRTTYSRGESSPAVSLTMRQLFVPGRVGDALASTASVPALRTFSLSMEDGIRITEALRLDYGFSLDSVTFFDRLNYLSPYARAKYTLSENETLEFGYSSGVPRPEAMRDIEMQGRESVAPRDAALQTQLNSLALFPRLSLRDGRARVQRSENFEFGYTRIAGSRTYRASVFEESVSNAALTLVGGSGLNVGDVLPDLFTASSVFNAGEYASVGYMVGFTQALNENLSATATFSSGNALVAGGTELNDGTAEELRGMIRHGRHRALTTEMSARIPTSGTQLIASYQWADRRAATPTHYFMTQGTRAEAGLNIYVRQNIPSFLSLPRMEVTADLRNMLAQGYLGFLTGDGRRLLLMPTPRSFRGGLAFIF